MDLKGAKTAGGSRELPTTPTDLLGSILGQKQLPDQVSEDASCFPRVLR